MAKVNWTKNLLEGLYQSVETGNLNEVLEYIEYDGKGNIPDGMMCKTVPGRRFYGPVGSYIASLCFKGKHYDILEWFLDSGLKVSEFNLDEAYNSQGSFSDVHIGLDPGEQNRVKDLVLRLAKDGATPRFSQSCSNKGELILQIIEACSNDMSYLRALKKAGFSYVDLHGSNSISEKGAYTYAFENGLWDLAAFFLECNISVGASFSDDVGVISAGWETEAIDFVLEKGMTVEKFDCTASPETVKYALEKRMALAPTGWEWDHEVKDESLSENVRALHAVYDNRGSKKVPDTIRDDAGLTLDSVLSIPEGTREIAAGAFSGRTDLVEVRLPSSLERIGQNAFRETSLARIDIPDGVTEIGAGCFNRAWFLESVNIPASLSVLEGAKNNEASGVFSSTGLKSVEVFSPSIHVKEHAFCNCHKLESVTFNSLSVEIQEDAFFGCSNMELVSIPGAYSISISSKAFRKCSDALVIKAPTWQYSEVPTSMRRAAAIGFAEAVSEGAEVDPENEKLYSKYLKSQRKKLFGAMSKHVGVAKYMIEKGLLSDGDFSDIWAIAQEAKSDKLISLLETVGAGRENDADVEPADAMDPLTQTSSAFAADGGVPGDVLRLLHPVSDAGFEERRIDTLDKLSACIESGICAIPDGVTEIDVWEMPEMRVDTVLLPASVTAIEHLRLNAGGPAGFRVVLPKGIVRMWRGALEGVGELCLFDAPDCNRRELELGEQQGCKDGHQGYNVTILDPGSGEVRFKIWCAKDLRFGIRKQQEEIWESMKGPNGTDFKVEDDLFGELGPIDKVHVAINRLRWPIDLTYAATKRYEEYIRKSTKKILELLAEIGDAGSVQYLIEESLLNEYSAKTFLANMSREASSEIYDLLAKKYRKTDEKHRETDEKPAKKEKPTPAQAVDAAYKRFEKGDGGGVEDIESVAKRVGETARVRLLEVASAACGPDTIEKLYELFGSFRFTCNALALAIMGGRVENARALKKHGATLNYMGGGKLDDHLRYIHGKNCYHHKQSGKEIQPGATYVALFMGVDEASKKDPQRLWYSDLKSKWSTGKFPRTGDYSPCFQNGGVGTVMGVVDVLAAERKLTREELGSLALAAAHFGFTDEAARIASYLHGRMVWGCVSVRRGSNKKHVILQVPEDLLWNGCDARQARFACEFAIPNELTRWTAKNLSASFIKANPDVALLLVPFADRNISDPAALLTLCAERGTVDDLKRLMDDEGLSTKRRIESCIASAQAAGKLENVAWLLERNAE